MRLALNLELLDVIIRFMSRNGTPIHFIRLKAHYSKLSQLLRIRCFTLSRISKVTRLSGGYVGGATPVPIPNTVVKPSRADGTARATVWESRSLPDFFSTAPTPCRGWLFLAVSLAVVEAGYAK